MIYLSGPSPQHRCAHHLYAEHMCFANSLLQTSLEPLVAMAPPRATPRQSQSREIEISAPVGQQGLNEQTIARVLSLLESGPSAHAKCTQWLQQVHSPALTASDIARLEAVKARSIAELKSFVSTVDTILSSSADPAPSCGTVTRRPSISPATPVPVPHVQRAPFVSSQSTQSKKRRLNIIAASPEKKQRRHTSHSIH